MFLELPMNKIQVGAAPSPNLKTVRSKIGSLQNAAYKPGGGRVKIESRKLEWKAAPKIEALNDTYVSRGGDKKVIPVLSTTKTLINVVSGIWLRVFFRLKNGCVMTDVLNTV